MNSRRSSFSFPWRKGLGVERMTLQVVISVARNGEEFSLNIGLVKCWWLYLEAYFLAGVVYGHVCVTTEDANIIAKPSAVWEGFLV